MDTTAPQTERSTPGRPRILVVDDEDTVLHLATTVLGASFEVVTTLSPREALRILQDTSCHILLTDLRMAEMDGLALAKAAREICPGIHTIVMADRNGKDSVVEAINGHASDLLEESSSSGIPDRAAGKTGAALRADETVTEEERLRELTEVKSQFVAEASHELRTPLAVIREFVSLVHDEVMGQLTDKQKEFLQSALRNCDRITELINKMLDLAKIEAGKAELNRERIDITALLTECYRDFLPSCEARKQQLLLEMPDDVPAVHCDAASIHEVLENLLSNAQKFTPEGGTIRTGCQREGQFVSVYVGDDGPGIAPEAQEKIFDPFTQIGREYGPGAKGTGLGLTIVKNLVQLNGGYVSLDSAPGEGTRFSFTIPMYDREAPYRVLVVDDEEKVVRSVTRILKHSDLNLEVESSLNALESLIVAGQFGPHLVILDVHLAETDGKDILGLLKKKMPEGASKVLMISGDAYALTEMRDKGADDYLAKPFSSQVLIQKVVTLLGIERRQG